MAAVSIQASALDATRISMEGPINLDELSDDSSTQVLMYVGGPGAAGFTYYTTSNNGRFTISSGKTSFGVYEDVSAYTFTLYKTSEGYQIQTPVNNGYMPGFTGTATGNFGTKDEAGTFSATIVSSPEGHINSNYVYTFTNIADGGLAVTKASGALAVATANGAQFQFYKLISEDYTTEALDRSDWSITACSECSATAANTDGKAELIIDDDTSTYWHNNWNSSACSGTHANYFLIDCGNQVTFSDFTYTSRPSGSNGVYSNYELYTSPTAITDPVSYIAGHTPVSSGSLSSSEATTTLVTLDSPVTGRYVLMVRPYTSSNNFGTCADFKLYANSEAKAVDLTTASASMIQAYKEQLAPYVSALSPLIDSSLISDFNNYEPETSDLATEYAAIDAKAEACFTYLDKQTYYLNNTRRSQYLTAKSHTDGSLTNTMAYTTDPAKWQIRQVATGAPYFRLFNPCTQSYIASSSVSSLTTDANAAQVFYFFTNSGGENKTDNSVSIRLKDSSNGLNVDTNGWHSALTTWAYNDGGSAWDLSFVATPVADLQDGNYYRIRSNRGYYNQTSGSLLTAAGVLSDDIDNDRISLTHDGTNAGTIWQLKAVDGGGYKLINIIADYDEGQYGLYLPSGDDKQVALSAEPDTYYLIDASEYGITQKFPNGVALSSANSTSGNNCIDVNSSGKPIGNEWRPAISTNDGVANQGSVFYLEEVAAFDHANVEYAYIHSLPTAFSADATTLSTVTDLSANVPALYPEAISGTGYTISYDECTSIAEAVAEYRAVDLDAAAEAFDEAVADFYAQPIGKHIQFNQDTYWLGADDSSNVINSVTDGKTYLSTIWQFEAAPEGSTLPYIVKNVASGKYLGYQVWSNDDKDYPMVADAEQAHEFGFLRNGCGENQVRLSNGVVEAASSNKNCIYLADGSAKIWGNAVGQTILTVSGVVYDEMEYPATDDNKVTFANVSKNEHCGDLKITLKPISTTSTPAEAPAIRRITDQGDGSYVIDDSDIDENGTITIPNDGTVTSGNYLLTVPAGYFVDTDGNLNAEFSDTFTIGESGTVTSIDELTVDALEAAPAAIYDLQGRRVASPRAGQVYIQGGKLRLN
jgi:hypothetical protein